MHHNRLGSYLVGLFSSIAAFFLLFPYPIYAETTPNTQWNCTFTAGPLVYTQGLSYATVTITGTCTAPIQVGSTMTTQPVFTQTIPITAPGVSTSAPAAVIQPQTASLQANTSVAVAGQTITVSWNGIAHPTNTDWIGLFLQSDLQNNKYWAYTNVSGTCTSSNGNASSNGSCAFALPKDLPAGTYQLRLFANGNASAILATSPAFTIQASPQSPVIRTPISPIQPVQTNVAPTITTKQLAQGTQGEKYSTQIIVQDQNSNDSLAVSITTTELPRGMTFARTSEYVQNNIRYVVYTLSGTPQNAARFNPEVTVRDAQGASITKRFPLTIVDGTSTKKKVTTAAKAGKKTKAIPAQ